jgi:hypothetical protein
VKVFGARGGADELARVLDGTAPAGPATAPLAAVVARVESARPSLDALTAPRSEFRAALRTRLVAVASVQAHAPAPTPLHERGVAQALAWSRTATRRRSFGVAAGAMASVVAVTGVAVASDRSLPGEPFYAVKRATESVQLRTADGPVERGTRHLQFATERLDEVRALTGRRDSVALGAVVPGQPSASGPDAGLVLSALADMDADTRTGSSLLLDAARAEGSAAPLELLAGWTADQGRGLAELLPLLPSAARTQASASLALVGSVGEDAATLLSADLPSPAPTPTSVPTSPPTPAPPSATLTPGPQPAPSPGEPESPAPPGAAPTGAPTSAPTGAPVPAPARSRPAAPTAFIPLPSAPLPSLPSLPLPSAISLPPVVRPSSPLPPLSPLPLPSLPLRSLPDADLDGLTP